jgi:hypothetical protein
MYPERQATPHTHTQARQVIEDSNKTHVNKTHQWQTMPHTHTQEKQVIEDSHKTHMNKTQSWLQCNRMAGYVTYTYTGKTGFRGQQQNTHEQDWSLAAMHQNCKQHTR